MASSKKRILVALYHSYIDTSSGAAISLRDLMEALVKRGWEVRVLSGPRLDFEEHKTNEALLREQGIPFQKFRTTNEHVDFRLFMFRAGEINCALFEPKDAQSNPSQEVGKAWLSLYQETLKDWQPDMVITYGGFWMFRPMMRQAREIGAKRVFFLCNCEYRDQGMFNEVDVTIVPSRWHQKWCQEVVGIKTEPVYSLIPTERYLCVHRDPQYLTFVNPQPAKGVFIFAKIAEILQMTRLDIPMLVVEGRGKRDWLVKTGAKLSAKNLFHMKNTPDPRDYLKVTKLMLVPSVFQETFGRVAAEAMMNGIPVVGSDRGALPEVIGSGGRILSIPDNIQPDSCRQLTDNEAESWVHAVTTYWDNQDHFASAAKAAQDNSRKWSEIDVVDSFEELVTE